MSTTTTTTTATTNTITQSRSELINNFNPLQPTLTQRNEANQQRLAQLEQLQLRVVPPNTRPVFAAFQGQGRVLREESVAVPVAATQPSPSTAPFNREYFAQVATQLNRSRYSEIVRLLNEKKQKLDEEIEQLRREMQLQETDERRVDAIENRISDLTMRSEALIESEAAFAREDPSVVAELLGIGVQDITELRPVALIINRDPSLRRDLFVQNFDPMLLFAQLQDTNVEVRTQVQALLHRFLYPYETRQVDVREGVTFDAARLVFERSRELANLVPDRTSYEIRLYAPQDATNAEFARGIADEQLRYVVVQEGETLQEARQRLLSTLDPRIVAVVNRQTDLTFPLEIRMNPQFYEARALRTASLPTRYRNEIRRLNALIQKSMEELDSLSVEQGNMDRIRVIEREVMGERDEIETYTLALRMIEANPIRRVFTMESTPSISGSIFENEESVSRAGSFSRLGVFVPPTNIETRRGSRAETVPSRNLVLDDALALLVFDVARAYEENDLYAQNEALDAVLEFVQANEENNALESLLQFAYNIQFLPRELIAEQLRELSPEVSSFLVENPQILIAIAEAVERRSLNALEDSEDFVAQESDTDLVPFAEGEQKEKKEKKTVVLSEVIDAEAGSVYLRPNVRLAQVDVNSLDEVDCGRGSYIYEDATQVPFDTRMFKSRDSYYVVAVDGKVDQVLTQKQNKALKLESVPEKASVYGLVLDRTSRRVRIGNTSDYLFGSDRVESLLCIDENGRRVITKLQKIAEVDAKKILVEAQRDCYEGAYVLDDGSAIPFDAVVADTFEERGIAFVLVTDPLVDEIGLMSVNTALTSRLLGVAEPLIPKQVAYKDTRQLELKGGVLGNSSGMVAIRNVAYIDCVDENGNARKIETRRVKSVRDAEAPPFLSGARDVFIYPKSKKLYLDALDDLKVEIERTRSEIEQIKEKKTKKTRTDQYDRIEKELASAETQIREKQLELAVAIEERKKQSSNGELALLIEKYREELDELRVEKRRKSDSRDEIERRLAASDLSQELGQRLQNLELQKSEIRKQLVIEENEREDYEREAEEVTRNVNRVTRRRFRTRFLEEMDRARRGITKNDEELDEEREKRRSRFVQDYAAE